MLVKSGIDYSYKDKMFEQRKTSLKKFKGDSMGSTYHDLNAAIKAEPVLHTSTRGRYLHTRGRPWLRARGANRGGGLSVLVHLLLLHLVNIQEMNILVGGEGLNVH